MNGGFSDDQRGQGMVPALMVIALIGIVAAGSIRMMQVQIRENKSLSDKIASLELEQTLSSALADGSVCQYHLAGKTFDASRIGTSHPPVIDVGGSLLSAANAAAPPLAVVGQPASPQSNSLVVSSIQVANIAGSATSHQFTAKIQVNFDPTGVIRPLKPVQIPTTLTTGGSGSIQTISGCTVGSGGVGMPCSVTGWPLGGGTGFILLGMVSPSDGGAHFAPNTGLTMYSSMDDSRQCCYAAAGNQWCAFGGGLCCLAF